ncbi:hypothetical protein CsSME_00018311 [Camellia sinensis var. sinensis]
MLNSIGLVFIISVNICGSVSLLAIVSHSRISPVSKPLSLYTPFSPLHLTHHHWPSKPSGSGSPAKESSLPSTHEVLDQNFHGHRVRFPLGFRPTRLRHICIYRIIFFFHP